MVVGSLPGPSPLPPAQLCRPRGRTLALTRLQLAPDLGDQASLLLQQAGAAGLSFEALLRELASAAALRVGAEPLPPLDRQEPPLPLPSAAGGEADASLAAVREVAQFDLDKVTAYLDTHGLGFVPLPAAALAPAAAAAADEAPAGMAAAGAAAEAGVSLAGEDPLAEEEDDDPPAEDEDEEGAGEGAGSALLDASSWEDEAGGGGSEGDVAAPHRTPVWVLCGGEGPERQASLAGGLHAHLGLRADPAYEAEAFLLEPSLCGQAEERRRRELLSVSQQPRAAAARCCCRCTRAVLPPRPPADARALLPATAPPRHLPSLPPPLPATTLPQRRLDLLKLGMGEEEMLAEYTHLHLSRIRNPEPPSWRAPWRTVWRLTGSTALRGSVEDLQAACERAAGAAALTPSDRVHSGAAVPSLLLSAAQQEAALAGLALDGSPWGGAPPEALAAAAPQPMLLRDFVAEAFAAGAVVLLALGREGAMCGELQAMLEAAGESARRAERAGRRGPPAAGLAALHAHAAAPRRLVGAWHAPTAARRTPLLPCRPQACLTPPAPAWPPRCARTERRWPSSCSRWTWGRRACPARRSTA